MASDVQVVPVTVAVTPAIFSMLGPALDAPARRVEAELSELASDLRLDVRPAVEVVEGTSEGAHDLLQLSVRGAPLPFFRPSLADAVAYVEGTERVATDADAALERLRRLAEAGPERLAEVLALVCREALSAQADVMLPPGDGAASPPGSGEDVEAGIAASAARTIDIHVHPDYLRLLTAADARGENFPLLRDGLFAELGLPLPPFHFRPDPALRAAGFAFRINAIRTMPRIGLLSDAILVNETAERLADLYDVDAIPTLNPATYQPGALTAAEHKAALEEEGLTTWDSFGFLILSLAEAIRRRAPALMNSEVAGEMIHQLEFVFPVLAAAARTYAPPHVLAPALRELLADGVPIRNLRRILELLIRRETTDDRHDRPDRATFIRAGMADVIAHNAARGTDTVVAYLLDPPIEDALADREHGSAPTSEDALAERLRSAVRTELSSLPPTAQLPALLTQDELRTPLRNVLRHEFPRMNVLGYGDLPPERNVQPVARISWA